MQDFNTMDLDSMMRDIISIFTEVEGVELVRLSGLFLRERKLSNYHSLTPEELDRIIHKFKERKIIHYEYVLYCPHCNEVTYQIKKLDNPFSAKVCDTCQSIYIPTKDISMFEYDNTIGGD